MPWKIYWDNGAEACGVWDLPTFDDEVEAEEYAESITKDHIAEGVWDEEGCAEPIWVDAEPNPDEAEVEVEVEQSIDYFNRYVAGDR